MAALRIMNHLQANTVKLDISHNLLGTGGAMTLVKGLAHVRQRYSSDTSRIWTLKEVNMAFNSLGDEGLESVLGWAKKDLGLRKLLLQGNDIKVSSTRIEKVQAEPVSWRSFLTSMGFSTI